MSDIIPGCRERTNFIFIYSINFLIIFTNGYSEFHADAIFKRLSYTQTDCI